MRVVASVQQKLPVDDWPTTNTARELYGRIDNDAAGIMYWVIAFCSLAGDVLDLRFYQCLSEFRNELLEQTEIAIENSLVNVEIGETSVDRAAAGARLTEYLSGRIQPRCASAS